MAPPKKKVKKESQTTLDFSRPQTPVKKPPTTRKITSFFTSPSTNAAQQASSGAGAVVSSSTKKEDPLSDEEVERYLLRHGTESDAILALKMVASDEHQSLAKVCETLGGFDLTGLQSFPRTERGSSIDPGELEEYEIVDLFFNGAGPSEASGTGQPEQAAAAEDRESFDKADYLAAMSDPMEPEKEAKQAEPVASTSAAGKQKANLVQMDRDIEAIPLSDDIFAFDPISQVDTTHWPRVAAADGSGDQVPSTPYMLMAHAFTLISSTRSRLAITTLLTNLLRVIRAHDPASLLPAVYLVSNHIAPAYDGVELGLGGSIINKAISSVTGVTRNRMHQLWNSTGDAGDVAFEAKKTTSTLIQPVPLTVAKLYKSLQTIASIKGTGSAAGKSSHVTKLLVASRGEETRFLVRTFVSHLRIQAVRTTIATALARTFALIEGDSSDKEAAARAEKSRYLIAPAERKGLIVNASKQSERSNPARLVMMERLKIAEKLVRQVRARHPNFSVLVLALFEVGLDGLSAKVPLSVGTPLMPMLGSITRSLDEMRVKLGNRPFVSEFKYDGQRVQIHARFLAYPDDAGAKSPDWIAQQKRAAPEGKGKWVRCGSEGEVWVRLFSRHLEDMTAKYPDICDLMPLLMGRQTSTTACSSCVTSLIMDAEIVAISLQGELLPFQTLSNRSRKDVSINDVKIKVGVFAFDLMYLDDKVRW